MTQRSTPVTAAELAHKASMLAEGTRRQYLSGNNKGDMWFFELWHFLGDVQVALAATPAVGGEAITRTKVGKPLIIISLDAVWLDESRDRAYILEEAVRAALPASQPASPLITSEMIEAAARVHSPFAFEADPSIPLHRAQARDEACKEVRAILEAASPLRGRGALASLLTIIDGLDQYQKRPERGDYGVECACCMGELFDADDRVKIEAARILSAAPPEQPADPLSELVSGFAKALLAKLRLASANGRSGWERDDWEKQCQQGLLRHLEKGDPRDVAAYCAFMWHHGWITAPPEQPAALPLAVRLRDEAGPSLPQMVAQRRAQLSQEQPAAAPVTEITEDEVLDLLYEHVELKTSDGIPEIVGYGKFVAALLARLPTNASDKTALISEERS